MRHAAQNAGAGSLLSATIPYGQPLRLARNVRQYTQLGDGRVLCDADHAFNGTQNRIEVVDEQRGVAQWVAQSANGYQFAPGGRDLFVDVVIGPSGHDVVRVPIPPKLP